MSFKDECEAAVRDIVRTPFSHRSAREVPRTEDVVLKDGAVYLTAAYLYADMADSTGMAEKFDLDDAAKIIRAYLNAVCNVLRDRGGEIRSFDGDRVMAIFIGDDAADKAVDAALRIHWVVQNVVHENLVLWNDAYADKYYDGEWKIGHRSGIDLGTAMLVRGGVRGDNDLVSIGITPNAAAKLSDYKGGGPTIITTYLWDRLSYDNRWANNSSNNNPEDESIWSTSKVIDLGGGRSEVIRTSNWWRRYQ